MSYLENYIKNRSAEAQQNAFQYIVNDLLRDNKTGNDKLQTLTGVDMERKAPVQFVPSMFYVFIYVNGKEKSGNVEFYDAVPVILCTAHDEKSVTGINFNFMPNNIRAAFIDILTGNFQDYYDNEQYSDEFRVNEGLGFVLTNPASLSKLMELCKVLLKFDVSKCIRKYNKNQIFRTRVIENDMLESIINLSFKDAVRGINLAKIQMSGIA